MDDAIEIQFEKRFIYAIREGLITVHPAYQTGYLRLYGDVRFIFDHLLKTRSHGYDAQESGHMFRSEGSRDIYFGYVLDNPNVAHVWPFSASQTILSEWGKRFVKKAINGLPTNRLRP